MEHIILQDHQLASIAYDAVAETMQILFRRGGLYEYYNVPAEVYHQMLSPREAGYFSHSNPADPSHYRAFEALIKRGGFRFNRLGDSITTAAPAHRSAEPLPETMKAQGGPSGSSGHRQLSIVEVAPALPAEAEPVKKKTDDIVAQAQAMTVTDAATQGVAQEMLKTVALLQTEIETTFKPMKDAAYKSHKVICAQETMLLQPLRQAEGDLKRLIGAFVAEQNRLAREEENRQRVEARRMAEEEAAAQTVEQAIDQAIDLEARGNMPAAAAVLERPAPVAPIYRAPAPVAPAVAQTKGVGVRMAWTGMRILNAEQIPREWLMVNEAAIKRAGKDTQGKIKIAGVEFFEEPVVTTTRK